MEILFTFDLHKFCNLDVNREICKHCTLEMDLKSLCYFGSIVYKTKFIYIMHLNSQTERQPCIIFIQSGFSAQSGPMTYKIGNLFALNICRKFVRIRWKEETPLWCNDTALHLIRCSLAL